tara:strand:+ start:219 stop:425 length:207 start_codon:yes stop_codon:yes gene_type:complete
MNINIENFTDEQLANLKKDAGETLNWDMTDFQWQRAISRLRLIETRHDLGLDAVLGMLIIKHLELEKK